MKRATYITRLSHKDFVHIEPTFNWFEPLEVPSSFPLVYAKANELGYVVDEIINKVQPALTFTNVHSVKSTRDYWEVVMICNNVRQIAKIPKKRTAKIYLIERE